MRSAVVRPSDSGGRWESWQEVSRRVARGNAALCDSQGERVQEEAELERLIGSALVLMSGRHLAHGDDEQPNRSMEVFINCATAPTSFASLYLLLHGAGVGRCYDQGLAEMEKGIYEDGTGEPGFINVDQLEINLEGVSHFAAGGFVGSTRYQCERGTGALLRTIGRQGLARPHPHIVNPCGEISLHSLGGYCVIADVAPYFADSVEEIEVACRAAVRAMMRVNRLDSLYRAEVRRTNRIGIGLTGVHEFAWKFFGYDFYDLIDEQRSLDFWHVLAALSRAVRGEAVRYAGETTSLTDLQHALRTYQPRIRCCSVMPIAESAYEYLPEEPIAYEEYRRLCERIVCSHALQEDVGIEHLVCSSGGCPVDIRLTGSKAP